jgi:hypothetical protein
MTSSLANHIRVYNRPSSARQSEAMASELDYIVYGTILCWVWLAFIAIWSILKIHITVTIKSGKMKHCTKSVGQLAGETIWKQPVDPKVGLAFKDCMLMPIADKLYALCRGLKVDEEDIYHRGGCLRIVERYLQRLVELDGRPISVNELREALSNVDLKLVEPRFKELLTKRGIEVANPEGMFYRMYIRVETMLFCEDRDPIAPGLEDLLNVYLNIDPKNDFYFGDIDVSD